jgi:quercetin dioxygenase-like cupin family protein
MVRALALLGVAQTITATLALAEEPAPPTLGGSQHEHAFVINSRDMKWQKMVPELGDASPEIVILYVDPHTQATQLMIRCPQAMHVPKHWHTGNETHTIIRGSFVLDYEGLRREIGPGDFNYMPAKMVHEGWVKPDKDGFVIFFITVDRAWDIHWVEGPPNRSDLGKTAAK